ALEDCARIEGELMGPEMRESLWCAGDDARDQLTTALRPVARPQVALGVWLTLDRLAYRLNESAEVIFFVRAELRRFGWNCWRRSDLAGTGCWRTYGGSTRD